MIQRCLNFGSWVYDKWLILSTFGIITIVLLFWITYLYIVHVEDGENIFGPERDDFGYPFTKLKEIPPPSFDYLPPDRHTLDYCVKNYECRYVRDPDYGVVYREFVCPQYDGEYIKHRSTSRQIRVYFQLLTAFLDFIKSVKCDVPEDERYLAMFNIALEVMREDGIPMPWHFDVDLCVNIDVLTAARDQGLVGKKFGLSKLSPYPKKLRGLDIAKEVHLSREKRTGYENNVYHGWGDDAGFYYGGERGTSGTRLQIEGFKVVGDEIAIAFWNDTPENRKKGIWMPKDWFFPAKKYRYVGAFDLYGPKKMNEYLVDQYGQNWTTPLITCDPSTRKWGKNFDYVARY